MNTDLFIELNQRYLDVSEDNLQETAAYIANCEIGLTSIGRTIIAQYFIKTFRVRPKKFDLIADLFVETIKLPSIYNIKELPTKLLDYSFGYDNESDYKVRIRAFYFIRKLVKKGVFDVNRDIIPRVLDHVDENENCRPYIFNCCCWAPEVDAVSPGFFDEDHINRQHVEDIDLLKDFFDNYDKIRANNWDLFHRSIENEEVPGSIVDIIMKDDLDAFVALSTSEPDFDYNGIIPISFFEHRTMLQRQSKYIHAAAFFGSIQILKFLLVMNVPINEQDGFSYYTAQYAVCGGSIEAVRLCEQHGANFLGAAQLAIEYFQPEILNWIYENLPKTVWSLDMFNRGRIHNASLVGNLAAFIDAVETGDKINQMMEGAQPIILAIKCNSFEIVMYILSMGISFKDLKKIKYEHQTLMQVAITYSKDEMIDFLIEKMPEWDHWFAFIPDVDDLFFAIQMRRPSLIMKFAERMNLAENPERRHFLHTAINLGSFRAIRIMAQKPEWFPFKPDLLPANINSLEPLLNLLIELGIISKDRKELPDYAQPGYKYQRKATDYIKEKTGLMPDPFWICGTNKVSSGSVIEALLMSLAQGDSDIAFDRDQNLLTFGPDLIGPLAYNNSNVEFDEDLSYEEDDLEIQMEEEEDGEIAELTAEDIRNLIERLHPDHEEEEDQDPQ